MEYCHNDDIPLKDCPTLRRPTVNIDANEVAFRYLNIAIGPAGSVFGLGKSLSLLGIDVVLVGDSVDFRYDKKGQQLNEWQKGSVLAFIASIIKLN